MSECIDTPDLHLAWSDLPWDSAVTGFPVLQINHLEVRGSGADMHLFDLARDRLGAGLVICKLPHDRLDLSMFLETHGFRFIEMLYQPELQLTPDWHGHQLVAPLQIRRALKEDLPEIIAMAGGAFNNERFHMDPRLGASMGDKRYQNWVRSSFDHPAQVVYVLLDEQRPVAFFITESLAEDTCYWHLNAVAPRLQGQGYGRRAWLTMLRHAADVGAKRVRTCIVARNHRVLNLYARLGFSFPPPQMTFHWVREARP